MIVIMRPKLREQLPPELKSKAGWLIDMTVDMTRGDIDKGASGYVMVDKDFNPTGAPPPDPDGAYCMVCWQRILDWDDDTAFPTEISFDGDSVDVAGGTCCEKCSQLSDAEIVAKLPKKRPPLIKLGRVR